MKKIKARNPNSSDLIEKRKKGENTDNIGFKEIVDVDVDEWNVYVDKDIMVNDDSRVKYDNLGRQKTLVNRIFLNDRVVSYYTDEIGRYFVVVEEIDLSNHLNKTQPEIEDPYQELSPIINNMLNSDSIEYNWKNYRKDADRIAKEKTQTNRKTINNRRRRNDVRQ